MRNHGRWPALAVLVVAQFLSACSEPPNGESAAAASSGAAANVESAPLMTVNQLMHAILFPLGNAVFLAQSEDPDALPSDPQPSF